MTVAAPPSDQEREGSHAIDPSSDVRSIWDMSGYSTVNRIMSLGGDWLWRHACLESLVASFVSWIGCYEKAKLDTQARILNAHIRINASRVPTANGMPVSIGTTMMLQALRTPIMSAFLISKCT
jgi:hypothetical protein